MFGAQAVRDIVIEEQERVIEGGIVTAIRGQAVDIQLDGSRKQVRDVLLPSHVAVIELGWWAMLTKMPRSNRWVVIAAYENLTGAPVSVTGDVPQPENVTATAKPYYIELSWSGSFRLETTYEIQHNSSASATGATLIKWEGSNYFYWAVPGTQRYFRVRAVNEDFERSSWSDWVDDTVPAGVEDMFLALDAALEPEWVAFDWDDVAAVAGADMVHDHSSAAEGGTHWGGVTQTFGGGDNANIVIFPDNLANPLYYRDAGDANAYLTFVSTNGSREVVVNQDGHANIDFRVEWDSGTQALFVEGSTGNVYMDRHLTLSGATLSFGAGSGANIISIPDGLAQGFILIDGGPVEYLLIDTAPQLVVHFNRGEADIDHIFSASGITNALRILGSTGAITIDGPSIDVVDDFWLGGSVANARLVWDFTPTPDEIRVEDANFDLNDNDLILDADGDSYLHAVADDQIALVLATASGQFDVVINGATDFTFTANVLDVLAGSKITLTGGEIEFTAASGSNLVEVPDNIADAWHLSDAGGLEYVRINSQNANPYVIFDPTAAGIFVSIGTATPGERLDVNGNIQLRDSPVTGFSDIHLNADTAGVRIQGGTGLNFGASIEFFGEDRAANAGTATITYGGGTAGSNAQTQAFFKIRYLEDVNTLTDVIYIDRNMNTGFRTTTPDRLVHAEVGDAVTAANTFALRLSHVSTGTPAPLFSTGLEIELEDGGNVMQVVSELVTLWATATAGAESPLFRGTTYPIGAAGPGYWGFWTWDDLDDTARTIVPNGAGDVTSGVTVMYWLSESGGGTDGNVIMVANGAAVDLYDDGTDVFTLTVAADGSVTVVRSAGATTADLSLLMCWV